MKIHPKLLACIGDDPAQDQDLAQVDDDSEELAKLMDGSGSSSESTAKGKGQLPSTVVHPSRGSEKHHSGSCQPCSFFLRGKCTVAEGCLYCHYEHDRPQRPGKKSRERAKRRIANAKALEPSMGYTGDGGGQSLPGSVSGQSCTSAWFGAHTFSAKCPEYDLPQPADGSICATARFSTRARCIAGSARASTWCDPAVIWSRSKSGLWFMSRQGLGDAASLLARTLGEKSPVHEV